MINAKEIVKEYLKSFGDNQIERIQNYLDESIEVNYSTVGQYCGKENVIAALKLPYDFMGYTVTLCNYLEYSEEDNVIVSCIGQHLNYNEDVPYFYPVVYGGQYVFVINGQTGKILKVCFQLEYQNENTYYLHDWNLYEGVNDYSAVHSLCNYEKLHQHILKKENPAEDLTKLFFTVLDNRDTCFLKEMLSEEAVLSRETTYSARTIEKTADKLDEFIRETDEHYDLNEYAIRVNKVEKNDGKTVVNVQLLSPQRLNTKKLHIGNKYTSFYDEEGTVTFDSSWKITELHLGKVADMYYNGFDLLEV